MAYVSDTVRRKVAAAAQHRCGYCQTSQLISGAQLHIEHILPLARGGASDEDNLWLACAWCNSYKSDLTEAPDPVSGEKAALFNPRQQIWGEHFRWREDGLEIIGVTPTGRATVAALRMNNEYIRHYRDLSCQGFIMPRSEIQPEIV